MARRNGASGRSSVASSARASPRGRGSATPGLMRQTRPAQHHGLGAVAVDQVRPARQHRQEPQKGQREIRQLGAKIGLGQIAARGRGDADDAQPRAQLLHRQVMVRPQRGVVEAPGDDVHRLGVGTQGLRLGRAQDIGQRAAGVLRQPMADRRRSETACKGHMHHIHHEPREGRRRWKQAAGKAAPWLEKPRAGGAVPPPPPS